MITHAQLLELLRYEPETGQFIWLTGKNAWKPAGKLLPARKFTTRSGMSLPYWTVGILGKTYFRAKLAWFYVTGEWPAMEVDHRDTDSINDRWDNLREATRQQNNANRRTFKNNKTGHKGVHYRDDIKKYRAMISVGGRNRSLGHFEKFEEAAAVYEQHAVQA